MCSLRKSILNAEFRLYEKMCRLEFCAKIDRHLPEAERYRILVWQQRLLCVVMSRLRLHSYSRTARILQLHEDRVCKLSAKVVSNQIPIGNVLGYTLHFETPHLMDQAGFPSTNHGSGKGL
jgi:hypothetical protein